MTDRPPLAYTIFKAKERAIWLRIEEYDDGIV